MEEARRGGGVKGRGGEGARKGRKGGGGGQERNEVWGRGKEGIEGWGWGVKKGLEVGEWLGRSGSGKREKI